MILSETRPQISTSESRAGGPAALAFGGLHDLLQLMNVPREAWPADLHLSIAPRRLRAGTALVHEGATAECVYIIRFGTFKSVKVAEDGYEQVIGFVGQGDVIGFDALWTGRHPATTVALEECCVYALRFSELGELKQRVPAFDRAMQVALSRQLTRAGDLAEVMAAVSAEVRLARFIVQLSARMATQGRSPRRLVLRMTRRELASHLGVAHETVSRSFSALADCGYVVVHNRDVEILDMEGLVHCSRNTRGFVAEARPAAVAAARGSGLLSGRVHAPA